VGPPTNWTKGKLIGAGAFGRVFQGLDNETGHILAVKQVALTKDEALKGRVAEHIKALEAEVAVLQQLNHRNIVRYLGEAPCSIACARAAFDGCAHSLQEACLHAAPSCRH
jgi:serine/threonine protein kinase